MRLPKPLEVLLLCDRGLEHSAAPDQIRSDHGSTRKAYTSTKLRRAVAFSH